MRRAIALSEESVKNGGGPFGAVVARDGVILAEASNSVTIDADPTAHAEVNAIRKACFRQGGIDLSGCEIYCSCEPSNNRRDAARIGFSDNFIYDEIVLDARLREKQMLELLPYEGKRAFEMWTEKTDKTEY